MRSKKYDKIYQMRVDSRVLEKAMKYCDEEDLVLAMELRKIITRFAKEYDKGGE